MNETINTNTAPAVAPDAPSMESAASFADAETREILNLLNSGGQAADGGSCCGGSCCA